MTPLLRQSLALQDAEDRIAALRPRMARVDQLRHRLAGDDRVGAPTSARAHAGDTLTALATLTDLLPDDTSLTALSLQHGRLRLEGQSAAATRLIGALSDEPRIRNPGFVAPVVRGEDGRDVFSHRGRLRPVNALPALSLPTGRRGRTLALALALLAGSVLWTGVAAPLLGWYADRQESLRRQLAIGHRMAALVQTLPALQAAAEAAAARGACRREALLDGATDRSPRRRCSSAWTKWPAVPACASAASR